MFEIGTLSIVAGLTSLFFVVGAIGNWIAPPRIAADYARWGYASHFHYITAILELVTGVLLLPGSTRLYGAALGALIMAAALATLLRHKEYGHAIPPSLVLLACVAILAIGFASHF
jgi:hypothetical protein